MKFTKLIFISLVFISIYIIITQSVKDTRNDHSQMISPLPIEVSGVSGVTPMKTESVKEKPSGLKTVVDTALEGTKGTYRMVIRNLKTGESYAADEHKVFDAGSLYKLWVMATAYKQIQNGTLTEDQVLSEDIAVLNQKFSIDPGNAEQTEGIITLTVHDALQQMITISHNYSAMLLTAKIRLSSVSTFLQENGFSESTVGINGGSPSSTPYDIALFLEKLYNGKLATQQYTDEMIGLLKNQQLNQGLPKYLPVATDVANKTGEIDYLKHDAGIVYTDKGDYIIVVMSESDAPVAAQERIALISKGVYEYFYR
jgi:beta-lactamase class A